MTLRINFQLISLTRKSLMRNKAAKKRPEAKFEKETSCALLFLFLVMSFSLSLALKWLREKIISVKRKSWILKNGWGTVFAFAFGCVCVCERERECVCVGVCACVRESLLVWVCTCVSFGRVCMRVCRCVCGWDRERKIGDRWKKF